MSKYGQPRFQRRTMTRPMPAITRVEELPKRADNQAQREYDAAMAVIQAQTEQSSTEAIPPSAPLVEYTAADYKQDRLIALPSGKGIRVRPLSLSSMMRKGSIPNALVATARRSLGFAEKRPPTAAETDKTTAEALEFIDYMTCKLVASFKVVDKDPEDCTSDEVSVASFTDADKTALVNWTVRGQKALEPFRPVA